MSEIGDRIRQQVADSAVPVAYVRPGDTVSFGDHTGWLLITRVRVDPATGLVLLHFDPSRAETVRALPPSMQVWVRP